MKSKIKKLLKKRLVILDGATGTELQKYGMPAGVCLEKWCLDNPSVLTKVHTDYQKAGADIIYTSTFGANRLKLAHYGLKDDTVLINKWLASCAKDAVGKRAFVLGDIGPTGEFIKPFGDLEFREAVNIFKEQIKGLLSGGVDGFVIETMMDIQEARAALIAVRELTSAFTMVSMTYEKHGRTLNGNDPLSALITLQSLGADAVGCNCSTGPEDMLAFIRAMKSCATVPLLAKPNAGLPKLNHAAASSCMNPLEFASYAKNFIGAGVNFFGGCCGSTPEHIRELKKATTDKKPTPPLKAALSGLSSARNSIIIKKYGLTIIGERINPTGKKNLQQDLLRNKMTSVRHLAKDQEHDGADLLDVNIATPGVDEKIMLPQTVSNLTMATTLPLVLDSANVAALEKALEIYPGRALINSITGEKEKLKKLLPLAKKYGSMFILLPLDGKKVPETFKQRKKIIKRVFKKAITAGFKKDDIIVDTLTTAISCQPKAALETFKTIQWCHKTLKCHTLVGLSNISFGLPQRRLINETFLIMARAKGLNMAIADPLTKKAKKDKMAELVLLNKDKRGQKFITSFSKKSLKPIIRKKTQSLPLEKRIFGAILEGNKEEIDGLMEEALRLKTPAGQLMQKIMTPAILEVGELFKKKEYFLPQLIASAEVMEKAIDHLKPELKNNTGAFKKRPVIILATVKDDIHDIGKNIVALLLRNHAFQVIDLGKNIDAKKIISAAKHHHPAIIGLSALMTTTMVHMQEVVELARQEGLKTPFLIGGAVVTKTYANTIKAAYAKDGVEAVLMAKKLTQSPDARL